eukprot:COSAG02_NODE_11759_length_1661_cov_1.182458_3_plen_48_part_01
MTRGAAAARARPVWAHCGVSDRQPRGGNAFKEQKRNQAALERAGEPPT